MKKRSLVFSAILALLLVFAMVSCGGGKKAEPPKAAAAPKVLRLAEVSDTTTLNTQNDTEVVNAGIFNYCNSGLYLRVPNDNGIGTKIIGNIASGDPVKIDDFTWRVTIRKEAKWHNGKPINADTFMYTYKMLIDPLLINKMANFFYDREIRIKNAADYYTQKQPGKKPVAWEDVGIKKIDDYTLEFVTTQRYQVEDVKRHFLDRSMVPVYEPLYEAGMNATRTQTTYGSNLDSWVGCGPYILKTWNRDAERVYVKNPDHWLSDRYKFDRVEVRITPDRNARVQMWERGEIDYLMLDADLLATYRDDPRTHRSYRNTLHHIDVNTVNTTKAILKSDNLRHALYWAMDREAIAKLIDAVPMPIYINRLAGMLHPKGPYRDTPAAKALVPPNYGYDPDKARQFFDAALKDGGVKSVSLELMYSDTTVFYKMVGEYLEQHLPKVFGPDKFSLTLKAVPTANFYAQKDFRVNPNNWELAYGGWSSTMSYILPYAAFQYFIEAYAARPQPYISKEFDAFFASCQTEEVRFNPELLYQKSAELEALYLKYMINIPLWQPIDYEMFSDRIGLALKEFDPSISYGLWFSDIIK